MPCAICEKRKEKRFCPAVHDRICPTCCGEHREITLDCPADCPYLLQVRQHQGPRSLKQVDPQKSFAHLELPDEFIYKHEQIVVGLTFGIVKCAQADRNVNDQEVIAALTSMAKAYERRVNSGLVYQEPVPSTGQQAIIAELQALVSEYRKIEEQHLGYSSLKDSEVLKTLVFILRLALMRTSGRPKSRAFVDFLSARSGEKPDKTIVFPNTPGTHIVVP